MSSKGSSQRGQALIVIALAAVVLFGFVGLAVDGTAKFSDRRHAQNAADTAALAAALAKVTTLTDAETNPSISTTPEECPPSSPLTMADASDVCADLMTAGLDRATDNGYDGNPVTNTIAIHSPPISGYYASVADSDDYVQVIITSHVKTTFMRIFGVTQSDNIVSAVAYSKPGKNLTDGAAIISYDPNPTCPTGPGNGGGSVDVSGSSTLNLNRGGILINSGIACGYNAPNCPDINLTGGASINSVAVSPMDNIEQKDGFCTYPSVPENYGEEPILIPQDVYWPDVPAECGIAPKLPVKIGQVYNPSTDKWEDEYLIYPGFYTDFPQASLVPNNKHIYMASGVYCIDPTMNQDLSWNSAAFLSLTGSTVSDPSKTNYNKYHAYNTEGVTLYIRSGGGFKFNINSPIYLDATNDPDSEYQGYLLILEGTHTSIESCELEGGAYLDMNGLIWAPYCDITINGQSAPTAQINAQIVGWDIKITGNNEINFNYDPSNQVRIKRRLGLMK